MSPPRKGGQAVKPLCLLISAVTLLACGKAVDRLQPLSDEEADKYEAPRADGTCHAREATESWLFPGRIALLQARENLRLALDPCGNTVVIASYFSEYEQAMGGYRLFRDGTRQTGFGAGDIGANVFDLELDRYGNVLVISPSWLQVVTPAGQLHPGVSALGVPVTGENICSGPDDTWFVRGRRTVLVSLPSGDVLWERRGGISDGNKRVSLMLWRDNLVLYSTVGEIIPWAEGEPNGVAASVYSRSALDPDAEPHLWFNLTGAEDDDTFYAETALLAVKDERRYLGTTVYNAEPATHIRVSCRESMLFDIDDTEWKPDALGFCGALEALELGDDGSLYSLWTVPVETLDASVHPFEAEATLVRHDPDGAETGRWVLTDTFGRLAQDGSGAMDMKLVDGGKGAIIGALVGGPWNGRFFSYPSSLVVARVPLE
jgi:hypothetical protein